MPSTSQQHSMLTKMPYEKLFLLKTSNPKHKTRNTKWRTSFFEGPVSISWGSIAYEILCKPTFRSEDIEMRRGVVRSHTALKTRFWWAFIDWEGFWALYLISNMWIIGSAVPDEMYKPSGDQAWFIRADWESLLSCFHPKACISVCLSLISKSRSCFSWVLQIKTCRC